MEPGHGEGRSAPANGGGVGAPRGQSPQSAPALLLNCPAGAQRCQERQGEEVQSLCQEEVKGDGKAIGSVAQATGKQKVVFVYNQ